MKNLDELKQRHSTLLSTLANLNKIKENRTGDSFKFGIDYAMVSFKSRDPDFDEFIDKKIQEAEKMLSPIADRLKILDELAAEVVSK